MGDWEKDHGDTLWAGRREQDTDEHDAVIAPPVSQPPIPVRVCRECAAQAQTDGAFCPYCGARYARKRRLTRRIKVALALVLALLLAGGATAGVLVKRHHDRDVAARKQAAQLAAQQKRDDASRRADAKKQAQDLERSTRQDTVVSLESSVTEDAKKDVALGLIDGPVLRTQCDPSGGSNPDDLSAKTGDFTCLAVNKENQDGTSSGYRFSATINYDAGTYTWHLGG